MQNLSCAICGRSQKSEVLYKATFDFKKLDGQVFSARREPDGMHYQFKKCLNCGIIFSSPILEENKIRKFYEESDFEYEAESDYLKKDYGVLLRKVVNTKRLNDETKLLDIGCGNGFFLEEAKEMGVKNVYGIEPGEASIKKAKLEIRKRIKKGVLNSASFGPNYFDIATCFHTLDHIVDPNKFLKDAFRILKKGGKTIFVVHDTSGLSVKLFGEKSAIFDIEHIYLFNKSNLGKIFEKNGFRVLETGDLKNTYPLSYWMKMSPVPFKKQILRILEKTGFARFPIRIKAGNIYILAEK